MVSTAFAPRCRLPVRWHGIWAFSPSNAISRRDGIYGRKWHLWRLHRVATSLCDGIYGVTWHLWRDIASMVGHGIYGARAIAKCACSGRSVDPAEMDRIALAREQ
jgi:hypothetical protein